MADGKDYEIRTVADFFAVPVEDRGDCLQDFASWIAMTTLGRAFQPFVSAPTDVFRWTNDGRHDMNVTVRVVDEPIKSAP